MTDVIHRSGQNLLECLHAADEPQLPHQLLDGGRPPAPHRQICAVCARTHCATRLVVLRQLRQRAPAAARGDQHVQWPPRCARWPKSRH